MRETAKSLRLYFILTGLIAAAINGIAVLGGGAPLEQLVRLVGLAFGIAILVVGTKFADLLARSPKTILWVIVAQGSFVALVIVALALTSAPPAQYILPVLSLLLSWYLHRNTTRLAAEAAAAPAG